MDDIVDVPGRDFPSGLMLQKLDKIFAGSPRHEGILRCLGRGREEQKDLREPWRQAQVTAPINLEFGGIVGIASIIQRVGYRHMAERRNIDRLSSRPCG